MITCRKGNLNEYEDMIDFANYVFSQDSSPHDFKKLLPKLYSDHKNYSQYHYLLTEDDKIRAMVCAFPLEYQTPGIALKTACIGTVSVHPYTRGKGFMKELMLYMLDDLLSQGYAYLFLGGQRQRYEYFGFTPSGVQLNFTVTQTNLKHCFPEAKTTNLRIVPLSEGSLLDQAFSLYEATPYRMLRSKENFYDILCSWQSNPYAVLQSDEFAGYFILRPDGSITEFEMPEYIFYPSFLKELFTMTGKDQYYFPVSASEMNKINFFMKIAENWTISTNECYRILDWPVVLQALLSHKVVNEVIPEGSLVIRIDDTAYEITVVDQVPAVLNSTKSPDIILTSQEATSLLLSYAGKLQLHQYTNRFDTEKRACFLGWFPLPLHVSQNDCC